MWDWTCGALAKLGALADFAEHLKKIFKLSYVNYIPLETGPVIAINMSDAARTMLKRWPELFRRDGDGAFRSE